METVEKEFVHDVTEECKDKLEDWSDFWWNKLRSKFDYFKLPTFTCDFAGNFERSGN